VCGGGFDRYAGKDYSHRKAWMLERLATLSWVFAIDICAYAVMSNHYHLVLFVDRGRAKDWTAAGSDRAMAAIIWRTGTASEAERDRVPQIIETWRLRLHDLSWFMRCLNEHLALGPRRSILGGLHGEYSLARA
jgi:hypothetical protein